MARAKRTDRADARRRYRQIVSTTDEDDGDPQADAADARDAGTGPVPRRSSAAPQRMGFAAAMRAAYHRPDVRSDLAALPGLLRTRGFLFALALVLAGIAAILVAPTNAIAGALFQLVVLPPAMGPVFIVGFFAPRASYILGLIISIVDLIGYGAFVYVALPTLSTTPIDAEHQQGLLVSAFAAGPLSGLFFASAAAWYRRFLSMSSGQRRSAGRSAPGKSSASRSRRG